MPRITWAHITYVSNEHEEYERKVLEETLKYYEMGEERREKKASLKKAQEDGVQADIVRITREMEEMKAKRDEHKAKKNQFLVACNLLKEELYGLMTEYNKNIPIKLTCGSDVKALKKARDWLLEGTILRYGLALSATTLEEEEIRRTANSCNIFLPLANANNRRNQLQLIALRRREDVEHGVGEGEEAD